MRLTNAKKIALLLSAMLVFVLVLAALNLPRIRLMWHLARNAPGIAVHFIDVGDADSTLIVCQGQAMLIDGGNIGDTAARDYVLSQGITDLRYLVGTHPHADHMGGLSEVLQAVNVERVLCPMKSSSLGVFQHFRREVEKKGLQIEAAGPGDRFALGAATVTVCGPTQHYDALNNMSLVLRIEYGDVSFLIEGDAQQPAEQGMIDGGFAKRATVLRVGHHGSNDATSEGYLDVVAPGYAVISCGDNKNGHPHRRLLALLKEHDVTVYRTDLDGTVTALSDGRTVAFQKQK